MRRHADELGEASRPVDAHAERVGAQMLPPGPAVAAVPAHDMPSLVTVSPSSKPAHPRPELMHRADIFMADHHRHRNGPSGPAVPVPDMEVGAAKLPSAGL